MGFPMWLAQPSGALPTWVVCTSPCAVIGLLTVSNYFETISDPVNNAPLQVDDVLESLLHEE